jgi:hypothetical protein
MSAQDSVDIVHAFWDGVWIAHDPAAPTGSSLTI